MPIWTVGFLPFLFSVVFIPIIRRLGNKYNILTQQRNDRWTKRPVPKLGGIAIFLSYLLTMAMLLILGIENTERNPVSLHWHLVVASSIIFILGLIDDFKAFSPILKIVGQIFCATIVVFGGYTTEFFTPRIPEQGLAHLLNILLSYIWIIGITNALNLIDNMDGLAGGISFVAAAFLTFFFVKGGTSSLLVFSLVLVGSSFGFLIYNFPPASIFMGDSGSQLLGFMLAVLAIARQPQASNILAVMGIPILLFLVPIFDTLFVAYTRILRGDSPWIGGKDHTSHRLVSFGLSEKKTLLVFYSFSLIAGSLAYILEKIKYWYSLVFVPVILVALALLVAFLSELRVNEKSIDLQNEKPLTRLVAKLTYRWRLLELILDFTIISVSFYVAFLLRYNLNLSTVLIGRYLDYLPFAVGSVFISFWIFGIYKKSWRLFAIEDYITYFFASIVGSVLLFFCILVFSTTMIFPPLFYIFFQLTIFFSLILSRSSFLVFQLITDRETRKNGKRVLILGTGPDGEIAYQWIKDHPQLNMRLVGFISESQSLRARKIHGLSVFGGSNEIAKILLVGKIEGIIVSPDVQKTDSMVTQIIDQCLSHGCWVKKVTLVISDLSKLEL